MKHYLIFLSDRMDNLFDASISSNVTAPSKTLEIFYALEYFISKPPVSNSWLSSIHALTNRVKPNLVTLINGTI